MKALLPLLFFVATLPALFPTQSLAWDGRSEHTVTGRSDGEGHPWANQCTKAILDARYEAARLCYSRTGSDGWHYGTWGNCSENWFNKGQSISLSFFCAEESR